MFVSGLAWLGPAASPWMCAVSASTPADALSASPGSPKNSACSTSAAHNWTAENDKTCCPELRHAALQCLSSYLMYQGETNSSTWVLVHKSRQQTHERQKYAAEASKDAGMVLHRGCRSTYHRCSPLAQSGQALSDQQAALGCGLAPQTAQCAGTPRCTQTAAGHVASNSDADWL